MSGLKIAQHRENDEMKKLYYMGYYSDPDTTKNRKTAPSADTKTTYIINAIKKSGYDVEVLSFCACNYRNSIFNKNSGYTTEIEGKKVTFFTSYTSKFRALRVIGRWLTWSSIKKYIKKKCLDMDCKIIIYHSLALLKLCALLNKNRKDFTLEVEEIYADVIGQTKIKQREISATKLAESYIFPTRMLDNVINTEKKPSVIIHGTYQVEPLLENKIFNDGKIHCVYAGTLDPRKGGAAAAAAAEFLPENYHIHILGFGSDNEVSDMKSIVSSLLTKQHAKLTYDGLLTGEDYIRFIQSCDIGLSTQNPDAAFNATSFPSKILSYMANGLRVVSIRIPAIETSAVGNMLQYYDEQTPEQIAKAILSVNMSQKYDSRMLIKKLAEKFERDISELIGELEI